MINNPNVLTICSVFKPKKHLIDSINSFLNQTYTSSKLLIVDDGSGFEYDAFFDNLSEMFEQDRVLIKRHKDNKGLTYRLHESVNEAHEKYIARIDSGDIWMFDKLATQIEYLENNPDVLLVGCQANYVNESGVVISPSNFPINIQELDQAIKKQSGLFEHSSIVFRNGINYRKQYLYAQDLDLYLRLRKNGKLYNLNKIMLLSLVNQSGITSKKKPDQMHFQKLAYSEFKNVRIDSYKMKYKSIHYWLWRRAEPMYSKYVEMRLRRCKAGFLWLGLASIVYPVIGYRYLIRLFNGLL